MTKPERIWRVALALTGWALPFGLAFWLLYYYRWGWTPAMRLDPQEAILLLFAATLAGLCMIAGAFRRER